MAQAYTVEICAGVATGNVNIHTCLYITRPDGTSEAWGGVSWRSKPVATPL